ncbi:MAG: GAF domain-containing protein [Kouleothrix sp.]
MSILSMAVINFSYAWMYFQNSAALVWSTILADASWLVLLSFMLYVLVRIINDRSANLRLLHDLGNDLMGIPAADDEPALFQTICRKISEQYPYNHILIFLQKDGILQCVAGSSAESELLAREHFPLARDDPEALGIIRHVFETRNTYYTNQVQRDRYYRPHAALKNTQSELAAPIIVDDEIVGVLDIQDHRRGAFLAQDREIMAILAEHIGRVFDNSTALHAIVHSVARRFMSHHELEATLNDIARAAHDELKADIVLLYEHDPLINQVQLGACSGTPMAEERFQQLIDHSCTIVDRLLVAEEDYYFQANVREPTEYAILRWAKRFTPSYTFFEQENIVSLATLRFRANNDAVGVMFLLFRKPRTFKDSEKRKFFVFADLAGLAIQKAQIQQQQIRYQRERLAMQLHDDIIGNAFGISKLISAAQLDRSCTEPQRAHLATMQEAVQELTRNTRQLHRAWAEASALDLWLTVNRIVETTKHMHNIVFELSYDPNETIVQPQLINQLRSILNEAITNAIRHGGATTIRLVFEVIHHSLRVTIEDNGIGFGAYAQTGAGIPNMRARVQRCHGSFQIESAPGQGTRLHLTLPI